MNKNKKFTILIPNGTSPSNVGDQAILESLLKTIKGNFRDSYIILHSSDLKLYLKKIVDETNDTLYSWAVFEKTNPTSRIARVSTLLINLVAMNINSKFLAGPSKVKKIINDFKQADLIIFTGGGYLRSRKGLTQNLNLLMLALIAAFAQKSGAKKIVAPVSFGPFAHKWQEKLFVKLFRNFDIVALREIYSFDAISKYQLPNIIQSTDLALLMEENDKVSSPKKSTFILGFTIRSWLSEIKQEKLEDAYVQAITLFVKQNQIIVVQPIVQVDSPKYGDFDMKITQKISKKLRENKIHVLDIKKVEDVDSSKQIYAGIDLLLGMRMHSNIIAATQGTPFVAISYEYKTEGISKDLGMEEYCIKVDDVNDKNLYNLLLKAYKNKEKIKKTLQVSVNKIQEKEFKRWNEIFQTYARS